MRHARRSSTFRPRSRVASSTCRRWRASTASLSSVQYLTGKHALNGFTKGLSKEVATEGITVNAICPGLVITDLVQASAAPAAESAGMSTEAFLQQYAAEAALGRPITVEEVAALAVLVASPGGSGITGALLSVDGGTAAY